MSSNIKPGQKFYVKFINNAARVNPDGGYDAVVSKVGRKYFTLSVENNIYFERDIKFRIEDLEQETNYSSDYKLYNSREEYDKRTLKPKLIQEIQKLLNSFTYERLLEIQVSLDLKYR
jgi:hypothetical protein